MHWHNLVPLMTFESSTTYHSCKILENALPKLIVPKVLKLSLRCYLLQRYLMLQKCKKIKQGKRRPGPPSTMMNLTIIPENGPPVFLSSLDPNQTIKQILFNPLLSIPESQINDFAFRWQKKILDLSTPLRFSGLLSGSKVELVSIHSLGLKELRDLKNVNNQNNAVKVALQLGSKTGSRLTGNFRASATLWQILLYFERISCNQFQTIFFNGEILHTPSLIIQNQTIDAIELLVRTTIGHLGITSGTVLIRATHKPSSITQDRLADLLSSVDTSAQILAEESITTMNTQNTTENLMQNSCPSSSPTISCDYDVDLVVTEISQSTPNITSPDLPDSFYDLNTNELRYFHSSAVKATKALNNAPLVSKSAQERIQQQSILKEHPFTRIRFRFPDRTCIERNFRTEDTIEVVHACLCALLHGSPAFVLCTGPPFKQLRPGDSLLSLNLYPAAIINVVWQGNLVVDTRRFIQQQVSDFEPQSKRPTSPVAPPVESSAPEQQKKSKSSLKIPKWLRLHK